MSTIFRIQEICKEKGITQKKLAKNLGISYQSLHSALNGNPTLSTLQNIAHELQVDVSDLFASKNNYIKCPNCGQKLILTEK